MTISSKSLLDLRRTLHRYPELSGCESGTSNIIASIFKEHDAAEIHEKVGGHGLLVVYSQNLPGPTVLFRCELDALPIAESDDLSYSSIYHGISHKCGHDGHMTILAGLGIWLSKQTALKGKVGLLFQPAEETGEGAQSVLKDGILDDLNPDYCFALHNLPGVEMHKVLIFPEQFSAAVVSGKILLKGKSGHASNPKSGISPLNAIQEVLALLQRLNRHDYQDRQFSLITPVHIRLGSIDYGISPADGELHFTMRTWDDPNLEKLKTKIANDISAICEKENLSHSLTWLAYFPPVVNNPSCTSAIKSAAVKCGMTLETAQLPCKFGEDFGHISKKFSSAMFALGAGMSSPPLHDPEYDFPDELIDSGIAMFKAMVLNLCT